MAVREAEMHVLPIAGVAAKIELDDSTETFQIAPTDQTSDACGTVFCFMPLPIRYQLPVYINGYFGSPLKSNTAV